MSYQTPGDQPTTNNTRRNLTILGCLVALALLGLGVLLVASQSGLGSSSTFVPPQPIVAPAPGQFAVPLDALVPNKNERAFLTAPRLEGDHYVIETDKTHMDADGHPCCGPVVTFATTVGGTFDYWNGFGKPQGDGCQVTQITDPTSGHQAWRATCAKGAKATFQSDGVSWTPPR